MIQLMAERQSATGRRITSRSVAQELDIPENSFSRYLRRAEPPGDEVVTPLAEYFGVTRGWLRYGEGEKYIDVVIHNRDGTISAVEAKRTETPKLGMKPASDAPAAKKTRRRA